MPQPPKQGLQKKGHKDRPQPNRSQNRRPRPVLDIQATTYRLEHYMNNLFPLSPAGQGSPGLPDNDMSNFSLAPAPMQTEYPDLPSPYGNPLDTNPGMNAIPINHAEDQQVPYPSMHGTPHPLDCACNICEMRFGTNSLADYLQDDMDVDEDVGGY